MIEVDALEKRFDGIVAVDSLSFTVKPGEVLGFLGPNGAGKSTTMKMITGFLRPTSGTARICGHDIQQAPVEAKKLIGYLPEGAPSYGDMTVTEFLLFIADVRGIPASERKARVQSVADQVHLNAVMQKPVSTLSKGYRRRVGLAQAIIHDPKVLILDEPTDGLDPNQKHEVRKLIQGMAEDKIIIISTHILEEVTAVCNRAMIIAHGRLLADGTPADLMERSRYNGAVTLQTSSPDEIAEKLKQLPAVASVEVAAASVTAFGSGDVDLLATLTTVVNDWPVDGIYQEQGRMDEVFRTITQPESDSKEAA